MLPFLQTISYTHDAWSCLRNPSSMYFSDLISVTTALFNVQVESTVAMQNIAPRVKAIQEEYKGRDQQEMQIKVGQLYKEAGINPLAGCLPTLATLPVWIGLYR